MSQPKGAQKRPWIAVLSGPNLDRLGTRQPELYGSVTLAEIHAMLSSLAEGEGFLVRCHQSASEGELVSLIHAAADQGACGLLINAGGYTHTSVALLDALLATGLPAVEVHLTLPEARESFRHASLLARACVGRVAGFGAGSYRLGLLGLIAHVGASVRTKDRTPGRGTRTPSRRSAPRKTR